MKHLFEVLLAAAIVLSFAGCGLGYVPESKSEIYEIESELDTVIPGTPDEIEAVPEETGEDTEDEAVAGGSDGSENTVGYTPLYESSPEDGTATEAEQPAMTEDAPKASAPAVEDCSFFRAQCGYACYDTGVISIAKGPDKSEVSRHNYVQAASTGTYEFCTDDGMSGDQWYVYVLDSIPGAIGNWSAGDPAVTNDGTAFVKEGQYILFQCVPPSGATENTDSVYAFQLLK